MAKDGYPFFGSIVVLAVLAAMLQWIFAAAVFLILALFVAFFFRDPHRVIPADASLVVSPADGKVVRIQKASYDGLGPCHRISIFLSVFNVHINRIPIDGRITDIQYRRGKFIGAFNHRASDENEQNSLWIRHENRTFRVTQIAGLIARRIVCWKKPEDPASRGERFGLIRFGSRVDLDLPEDVELLVKVGDHVKGGGTAVGRLTAVSANAAHSNRSFYGHNRSH